MDGKKPTSNIEDNTTNKNKYNQQYMQEDLSDLSGPVLFARADDILFSVAMEDEILLGPDIEIGEKILNTGNMNNQPHTSIEKPVIEEKEKKVEIEPKKIENIPVKVEIEPKKVENVAEKFEVKEEKVESEDAKLPIEIKGYVSEEIYEFDLSDPITEPTTVRGGEEEPFNEEILTVESSSEAPIVHEHFSIEIPKIAETKSVVEIDTAPPVFIEKPVQSEEKSPNIKAIPESKPKELVQVSEVMSEITETPSAWKHIDGEEPYSPENETSFERCFPTEDMEYSEEPDIEIGRNVSGLTNLDKIKEIVQEGKHIDIEVDVSHEHIILINNSQDFLKYQHSIMDNRCISFFWPSDEKGVIGTRISISTEKEKTFIIDLDKIDINLMNVLIKTQRPIKIFHNAKPVIIWFLKNNLKLNHIFDINNAMSILSDGQTIDNSLKSIMKRYANLDIVHEDINFQDFVLIGKFIFMFRKKLVDCMQELNLIKTLNFEQNLLFALAQSEADGMPYNALYANPMSQNVWDLVESKYGISSKKGLAKAGILFFNKYYLTEKKNLLEVSEYASLESAERTIKNFDKKLIKDGRIYSTLVSGPSGSIITKNYSFDGEGLYPFIGPEKDNCLVTGEYKNLEVRVVAKLLNNRKLIESFSTKGGPFSYFAGPLFEKSPEEVSIDEKFIAKMIFEIVIRNLGERETLYHAWNISKSFIKEEEIITLKEKFKKVHPDLTNLIKETYKQTKKDGYISSSTGRITVANNWNKAFFTQVEMYINEIFKRALDLSFSDFESYNAEFTNKIKLCTIYNRILTFECNKKIVNIAIDMLTRNMIKIAAKTLKGIPVLLKVNATEQWEA